MDRVTSSAVPTSRTRARVMETRTSIKLNPRSFMVGLRTTDSSRGRARPGGLFSGEERGKEAKNVNWRG
jgi:hypothetical protein